MLVARVLWLDETDGSRGRGHRQRRLVHQLGGLTGPNWLARAPVCRRLEESDTNYLPPRRCFVWDHVNPPPQKEMLACFEVGGWLAHRGGTCELRRGEGEGERTAAGGCPATAAGEGDTGPDFKSLRARAPCQVRAVHRVGRP